jgi:NAD+ synthase (glutamine-hydrolysing)
VKVALAQIETRVGAIARNEERIVHAAHEARAKGAELVLFPELAVTGYPPRDLLFREEFVREAARATARIAARTSGITVVLGSVEPGRRKLRNVACVLEGGAVKATRAKTLLPSYSVFMEERWFEPGSLNCWLDLMGVGIGVVICEDLWDETYEKKPARDLVHQGAKLLLALNASPFRTGIMEERLRRARAQHVPLAYVNAVGAEDELVFDGGSFAVDGEGRVLASLPRFEEAVQVVDMAAPPPRPSPRCAGGGGEAEIFQALTLGIRSFATRNGARDAVLGLSGGVDSALAACLAKEALGPEHVRALAIPSRFNDPRSLEDARALARNLGIHFSVVPLEPLLEAAERHLDLSGPTTFENVQARLRMVILMADVNRSGGLLLNTSNRTELALGYGTLFGDLAGDLAPLGDLSKPEVYALARHYDARTHAIPPYILERPPSAELAPNQVDPFDYDAVSPVVDALARGAPPRSSTNTHEFERRVQAAEFKRRLAPIILKVHEDSFGSGRWVPVTAFR